MLANQIGLSDKVVSERHYYASQEKYTAGEAAKIISKQLKLKVLAKDIVSAYQLLGRGKPEWHHSGFYKSSGKSNMGITYFFNDEDIKFLIENWSKIFLVQNEKEIERKILSETTVWGFYYTWDYDYGGYCGKKRNYKVLQTYYGPALTKPKNFTACFSTDFECIKSFVGKKYFGWDEPKLSDFIVDNC